MYLHRPPNFSCTEKNLHWAQKLKSSAKILIHDNKNSHHCDGDDDVRLF